MTTTHKLRIMPYDRIIEAKDGRSIMETLIDHSIFLRSDCGGRGSCGKCQVNITGNGREGENVSSCTYEVDTDLSIEIPKSSMLSSHIITKAPVSFPESFTQRDREKGQDCSYGIAADLGTTTLAIYLCEIISRTVLSSLAIKNPQALYGDDVMSRIGAINQKKDNLQHLQKLVVNALEWGISELVSKENKQVSEITRIVAVGNPTMIHILAGVDPGPIGVSPYQPAFNDARTLQSGQIGFTLADIPVQLLPQVSGFIGGDILSAALAVDFDTQPEGTVLIDLGTNGELLIKGKNALFATSGATGPAFEGATLSCGTQAIPGAVNKITIGHKSNYSEYTFINPKNSSKVKPFGVCGTGVISAVAEFCRKGIISKEGAFESDVTILPIQQDSDGKKMYVLVPEREGQDGSSVNISQKDIRSVQLGKSALVTAIDFLLKAAGFDKAKKIIIAGAFGTYINKEDMLTLGMIPEIDLNRIEIAGNSAGTGAIMVLCDEGYLTQSMDMSERIRVINLATNLKFQEVFVQNLSFPIHRNKTFY